LHQSGGQPVGDLSIGTGDLADGLAAGLAQG
jgi:hypothetical protein